MGVGGGIFEPDPASPSTSSNATVGRGTDTASKETRLLCDESLGRWGLTLAPSEPEVVTVMVEEREDARAREDMPIDLGR